MSGLLLAASAIGLMRLDGRLGLLTWVCALASGLIVKHEYDSTFGRGLV